MNKACWLLFLAVGVSLSGAPDLRFNLETAIVPVRFEGPRGEVATVVRQLLTTDELSAEQRVGFSLRLRNFDELNTRIERGEVLTLDEMAERYLPRRETWLKVSRWVAAQGLTVEPEDSTHLTVVATGPVARVQTAMRMRFARVIGTDEQEHTSAVSAPAIPEEFRDAIVSVLHLQPHLQPLPAQVTDVQQLDGGFILPQTFARLYNATGLGVDGRGQTIAIMGAHRVNPDDLQTFWQTSGLPITLAQFTQVDLSNNPDPGDISKSGEETMDIEWASAMAPGADIVLLTNLSMDLVTPWISSQLAVGRRIHQLSTSYGLPEATYTLPAAEREARNQYYATLAALGVSIFVASGDDGSTQMIVNGTQPKRGYHPDGTASPLYPASSPYVTGVGGTTVAFQRGNGNSAAPPSTEGAWSIPNMWFPSLIGLRASGGGVSLYFPRPAWQVGAGLPAGTMRCVPDVAAMASCNYAPYMYFRGLRFPANGTSVSAPIWAGLCALINQARADKGLPPLGLLGPRIYPLNGTPAFNQMTTGSQSGGDGFSTTATNGAYAVGPNYNMVSGLGSPNVEYLITALTDAEPVPPPAPTPTPDPTPTPTPTPTPSIPSGGGGGGGGAPSQWFFAVLGLIFLVRKMTAY